MHPKSYDIIIIGGGIMGCATAFYLIKADPYLSVAVIERDPTYARASTTLSLANVRTQFSLKENILISKYAVEILDRFENDMSQGDVKPHIAYRKEGNLFLAHPSGLKAATAALDLQKELGCKTQWWTANQIKRHYPLYETRDLAGGTFGPEDGHFDPHGFLMGYRNTAKALGVIFINDEVIKIKVSAGKVMGVKLAGGKKLTAQSVVNCAGAWAAPIARTAGVVLPVQPVKRQVFVVDTAVKPKTPLPLTVLPSGLYFRSETGGFILIGKSMANDPMGVDFSWDPKRFTEQLWPELVAFVPAFDTLKVLRGWAGLYAVNTLDGNAILGPWPELKGLYLANGFSGHGLQQAPAVGRYLSELILGLSPTLDLSALGPERIFDHRPLCEIGLV